jgi:hypothetical protein
MPRPRKPGSDIWTWAWEKSGLFTVRSAYREVMDMKYRGNNSRELDRCGGDLENSMENQRSPQNKGLLVACAEGITPMFQ